MSQKFDTDDGGDRAGSHAPATQVEAGRVLYVAGKEPVTGATCTEAGLARSLAGAAPAAEVLRQMTLRGRARAIAEVARAWLAAVSTPDGGLASSLDRACAQAEISPAMLRWGCSQTFGQWSEEALLALVAQELGDPDAAWAGQSVASSASGAGTVGQSLAMPPRLCLQVLARTVPPAGWQAVALAWLLGSPVIVRPSSQLGLLVDELARILARVAPPLAAATWITRSSVEDRAWHVALAGHADAVVIHGSDETVARWQEHARPGALFIAHGHRVSAAFLPASALAAATLADHLRGLAVDLCAWDQTGCLSPVTLYVEDGGPLTADEVAHRLVTEALPAVEKELPPGPWDEPTRAARALFVRTRLVAARAHHSATASVLVFDTPAALEPSCLHRVLLVRPVASEQALLALLRQWAPHLQAVAVAADAGDRARLARELASSGVNRVCLPGELQRPPLAWSHDGRGALRPLVRWIDLD